jgi:cholesterol oxidase
MAESRHATFTVSELMKGYITLGDTDILSGYKTGLFAGTYIETQLTLNCDDMDRFVNDPAHAAVPSGSVISPALGGTLPISGGEFQLFVNTENDFVRRMNYRLFFTGTQGPMTLSGFKCLTDNPTAGIWFDCTWLWTKIFQGHVTAAEEENLKPIAAGVINLYILDFIKWNIFSFKTGGRGIFTPLIGFIQFFVFFLGTMIRFQFAKWLGRWVPGGPN